MITILVDHNIEGRSDFLRITLDKQGWLQDLPMRVVWLTDVGLPVNANDRQVWRFAQANGMFLLTGNRNNDGADSLQQTIVEENTPTSLPVINVGQPDRLTNRAYREDCAARLLDIVLYPENYLGTGRQYIP